MWPQLTVGGELGPARAAPNTVRWSSPTLDENRIARVLFPAYGNRDSGSRSELRWEKDCTAGANVGQAYVRAAAMSGEMRAAPRSPTSGRTTANRNAVAAGIASLSACCFDGARRNWA